jgi:hypothetical protein
MRYFKVPRTSHLTCIVPLNTIHLLRVCDCSGVCRSRQMCSLCQSILLLREWLTSRVLFPSELKSTRLEVRPI